MKQTTDEKFLVLTIGATSERDVSFQFLDLSERQTVLLSEYHQFFALLI